MDLDLSGKTAIVTGGSRGIGKAIARELATEGVDVAITARGREALEATAQELAGETGRRVVAIVANTRDDAAVKAMVEEAASALGHLDILVNNAARPGGPSPVPKLADLTYEMLEEDIDTKVMGYIRCAREVAPHMRSQGWGRIINISGMAARGSGTTIGSIRNVSVVAMTKNMADELGPDGINVTVVHPGTTRTERTAGMIEEAARSQRITEEEAEQRMGAGNSTRRIVDAQEVAYVVTFLASPKSVAINGDVIAAGGGVGRAIHY